eukprot:TRINITY_DN813_c1_g3_i1.p1 TRINITY_DN813_c1_g3~~TRINITY_DN813_c1_g3_i1.p1  ORF type:complete len:986 (+),score=198.99 TRINITY_DN813_c1_g3_i1:8222-11179(+)
MANDSHNAASLNDQEDGSNEPMEGITAPPASPADANPSTANKSTSEETHTLDAKHSAALKHREITSTASNAKPSAQLQAASTEAVHPEQAPVISNETQTEAEQNTQPGQATAATNKSAASSHQGAMREQTEDVKPSTRELRSSARNAANPSKRAQDEKDVEHVKKEQRSSRSSLAKTERQDSVQKPVRRSSRRAKQEPVSVSKSKQDPTRRANPEQTESKIAKGDVKRSDGNESNGSQEKSIPAHHKSSSEDPVEHSDSKPNKATGAEQERGDVEGENNGTETANSAKEHLLVSKSTEKTERSMLHDSEHKKSSDVAQGQKIQKANNQKSSSTDDKKCSRGKQQSVPGEDNPHSSASVSPDAQQDDLKDEAETKVSGKDITKNIGDDSPTSESNANSTAAKPKPSEEMPVAEQATTPMDVVSGSMQVESGKGEADEEKDAASAKESGGMSPVDTPKEGKAVNKSSEDVVMKESIPSKTDTGLDLASQAEDDNATSNTKARKSIRKVAPSRLLRTRSTSRGRAPDSSFDSGGKHDSAPSEHAKTPQQKSSDTASQASKGKEVVPEDDGPRPVMEAKGLIMRVGNAVFVTEDQLDEPKITRLNDKKVLPFERLTFKELRTYNRDQLRAYCFAYGMERRKKTEMEADMARYLSYWNRGKPGFALHEYIPTSGRIIDRDEFFGNRRSQANQSAASLGGVSHSGVDGSKRFGSRTQSASGGYGEKGSGSGAHASASANPQTSPSTPSAGNANRNLRAGGAPATLPRGIGTSFKQRAHARQASAKFKAAYNGAGATIVNVVENAAAYFEGKDSPEVIADQTKSFERYQFNVDLLTEIFDGPFEEDVEIPNVSVVKANGSLDASAGQSEKVKNSSASSGAQGKTDVMFDIAKRLLSNKRSARQAELDSFETNLKRVEEKAKHTERRNMRLFQKLERAETLGQVEAIKKEFEKEFGMAVDVSSRPIVRRKIDKTLPPLVIPDDQSRILRFTFL